MAIYHLHAKTISRARGQSATAAAAYRSGEKINDRTTEEEHDYTRKGGVIHSQIYLPEGIPERMKDRSELWNTIEEIEKRKDAQLAREIEVALPTELSREQQIELTRDFSETFTGAGMIADVSIHDKGDGNPHAHIMLSMRRWDRDKDTFGGKERTWNDKTLIDHWREAWETTANNALERAGRPERIDHRSNEERGLLEQPTIHTYGQPELIAINERIRESNARMRDELNDIDRQIEELKEAEREAEAATTAPIGEVETAVEPTDERQPTIEELRDMLRDYRARRDEWIKTNTAERLRIDREAETIEKTAITVKLQRIEADLRKLDPNSEEYDPPRKREGGIFGIGSKKVVDFDAMVEQQNKLVKDRREAEAEKTRIENRHLSSRASITTAAATEYDRQHPEEVRKYERINTALDAALEKQREREAEEKRQREAERKAREAERAAQHALQKQKPTRSRDDFERD